MLSLRAFRQRISSNIREPHVAHTGPRLLPQKRTLRDGTRSPSIVSWGALVIGAFAASLLLRKWSAPQTLNHITLVQFILRSAKRDLIARALKLNNFTCLGLDSFGLERAIAPFPVFLRTLEKYYFIWQVKILFLGTIKPTLLVLPPPPVWRGCSVDAYVVRYANCVPIPAAFSTWEVRIRFYKLYYINIVIFKPKQSIVKSKDS